MNQSFSTLALKVGELVQNIQPVPGHISAAGEAAATAAPSIERAAAALERLAAASKAAA